MMSYYNYNMFALLVAMMACLLPGIAIDWFLRKIGIDLWEKFVDVFGEEYEEN